MRSAAALAACAATAQAQYMAPIPPPTPQCAVVPTFVGDTHMFQVRQAACQDYSTPGFHRTAPAVERMMTPRDFYDYGSYSAHTGFEAVGRSIMFLYRDLRTPRELSLYMIHGQDQHKPCNILRPKSPCGGGNNEPQPWQEMANVYMDISGVPNNAHIAISDDSTAEFDWTNTLGFQGSTPSHSTGSTPATRYLAGRWQFKYNTDGGAIDRLSLDDCWEMRFDVKFGRAVNDQWGGAINWYDKSTMNDWRFYFADGSEQSLCQTQPLYIKNICGRSDPNSNPTIHAFHCTEIAGVTQVPVVHGTPATFCALATNAAGGTLSYDFSWGDGSANSGKQGASGVLTCMEHTYMAPSHGSHLVQVTVTNSAGCSANKKLGNACVEPASPTASPQGTSGMSMNGNTGVTGASGDPFVSYGKKKTQIYLPLGKESTLLQCDGASPWELRASVFGTGVTGDSQQWFRNFMVRSGDAEMLRVEASNAGSAVPKELAAALAAKEAAENWAAPLTTLSITDGGRTVGQTGFVHQRFFNYTVAQDMTRRIGKGFAESVTLATKGVSLELSSAEVNKDAAGGRMHVDLKITKLDATCRGTLPEVWGLVPMSSATAAMLLPPKA